ncbi:transmembrane and coiled-coil domain-containing protein 6-like isoform X2 [Lethenteron reissneri]|uniref:transmembrane and coiled-coil domain-containing protein 6-like isoform X2 n=1 Tax=Lethenteron reissneri TaxID=7753 RepID=UPI002AB64419|nr:transmembrane and coiled-coil domain-containing protein 6-like isoform X2 [Lethenteron reissneri]
MENRRRDLYKAAGPSSSVQGMRARRREEEAELRRARRESQLVSKRAPRGPAASPGSPSSPHEPQAAAAAETVPQLWLEVQRTASSGALGPRLEALRALRRALPNPDAQAAFIGVEGGVRSLVALLARGPELQLEAARSLLRLSHSALPAAPLACLASTSYLVTLLGGHSPQLTEVCLYTLANLVTESARAREQMMAQGLLPGIASCLQSPHGAVQEAAAFALSQLLQAPEAFDRIIPAVRAAGLPSLLRTPLVLTPGARDIPTSAVEAAWCLHYLACSGASDLVEEPLIREAVGVLVELGGRLLSSPIPEYAELLVVPLVRCVGNVVCGGLGEGSRRAVRDAGLLPVLLVLAERFLPKRPFVSRECLWLVGNLTAGEPAWCSVLLRLGAHVRLAALLRHGQGVGLMAARVLCTVAVRAGPSCSLLGGCPELLSAAASVSLGGEAAPGDRDPELRVTALQLWQPLLANSPEARAWFENEGGPAQLESLLLQSSGADERVRQVARVLLQAPPPAEGWLVT